MAFCSSCSKIDALTSLVICLVLSTSLPFPSFFSLVTSSALSPPRVLDFSNYGRKKKRQAPLKVKRKEK